MKGWRWNGNPKYPEGLIRSQPQTDPGTTEGRSAGDIAENFPVSAAAVSKHLAVLKDADLIRDVREGKFIFYELNTSVLEEVMLWLTGLKGECV